MKNQNSNNKQRKYIICLLIVLSLFFIISANNTYAVDEGIWAGVTDCRDDGICELNDFMQLVVNISGWLLGITGSLALLALVYGGIIFLISTGSSDKVNQAKQVIIGAVIGLAIVFLSYTIIGFTFKALGIEPAENNPWSSSNWFSPQ